LSEQCCRMKKVIKMNSLYNALRKTKKMCYLHSISSRWPPARFAHGRLSVEWLNLTQFIGEETDSRKCHAQGCPIIKWQFHDLWVSALCTAELNKQDK
jgi:hypothetical protein